MGHTALSCSTLPSIGDQWPVLFWLFFTSFSHSSLFPSFWALWPVLHAIDLVKGRLWLDSFLLVFIFETSKKWMHQAVFRVNRVTYVLREKMTSRTASQEAQRRLATRYRVSVEHRQRRTTLFDVSFAQWPFSHRKRSTPKPGVDWLCFSILTALSSVST